MYQSDYYLDKTSNTLADNLAAIGLAFVLDTISQGRAKVRLQDEGAYYRVVCEPAIQSAWIEQCDFFVGAPFLATYDDKVSSNVIKGTSLALAELPFAPTIVVDYEAERATRSQFIEWIKALSSKDRGSAMRGELSGPRPPHPDWDIFRAINPMGMKTYNSTVANWWFARPEFASLLQILLRLSSCTPNLVGSATQEWEQLAKRIGIESNKQVNAIQVLNPTQGKGSFNRKSVWTTPRQFPNFWLLEWLKIVGLFQGGITRQVRNVKDPKRKDRKTYVLAPKHLAWSDHVAVMNEFRRAMTGSDSAVKLDILAALRYTQALLRHYEEAREEDLAAQLYGRRATDLVHGLETAFYKDMGNAVATMNIAAINLPDWVKPATRSDLAQMQAVLDEHISIVRTLREDRGEQFELLVSYRNFLSGHDMNPFFAFTTAYSTFLVRQIERGEYARPFTLINLEVLLMNSDDEKKTFQKIVTTPGFRNIASAIRHSTVIPQGRKRRSAGGSGPTVDVRYGLGQQLARKAAYPSDFLAELGEFVFLYNAENAQLREKEREPYRINVSVQDLDAITELVDEFGSKIVCNLLVAYGYASQGRRAADESKGPDEDLDTDDAGLADDEEMDE